MTLIRNKLVQSSNVAKTVASLKNKKRLSRMRAKNAFNNYRREGHAFVKKQKYDDAISSYVKALLILPSGTQVVYDIGKVLEKQGFSEEADFCFKNHDIPEHIFKRYTEFHHEWQVGHSFSCEQIVSHNIYPHHKISLTLPKTIHKFINTPQFIETLANFSQASVALIPNGIGWSNHLTSAIITQNNCLLADVSTGASNSIIASNKHLTDCSLKINGTVAFLSSRWGSAAYFHWMLDVLPRVGLLLEADLKLDNIDYFVFHEPHTSFNQESLAKLGIPNSKIIDTKHHLCVQARQLVVPSIIRGYRGTEWSIKFLRDLFLSPENDTLNNNTFERIYITRKKAPKRKIANEQEVLEILEQYNFQEVILESLSVSEQAQIFFNAKAIVAPHGAGLTNIVFSQANTKLLEIFSPDYINTVYWQISSQCNLDYYYLIGENVNNNSNFENNGAKDILVNLKYFSELLKIVFDE
jgi:capsular polysaccharide biosynthesis protein